ncbi:homoserine kinase [Buchnera aphidicola]|uniref:homoserine kinase n=1 Tax=Buchnera aphidicola TaxID=9 RepID=UPI0030EF6CFC
MIKIYAPASIGNIGVGFDILGASIIPIDNSILGDYVTIKNYKKFKFVCIGKFSTELNKNLKKNVVLQACKNFFKKIKKKIPKIKIILEKNMPIGSGLGSSSSSIVASLSALNIFFKNPLNKEEMLKMMGNLEKYVSKEIHYDNVAPSYLGGIRIIIKKNRIIKCQKIPHFKNWLWVIAWPGTNLSTQVSRSVLPNYYARKICIKHSLNIATFIHASHTNQEKLAIKYMKDVIAEPYRKKLLYKFDEIKKKIKKIGGINLGISGSGPTIFSICTKIKIAYKIKKYLKKNFIKKNGFVKICKINSKGAQQIEKNNYETI